MKRPKDKVWRWFRLDAQQSTNRKVKKGVACGSRFAVVVVDFIGAE